MYEYWDNSCKKISNLLWIPSLIESSSESNKKIDWGNQNKHISFTYYQSDTIIDPSLKFKEIPSIDINSEKMKLFSKLYGSELGRFSKQITNKKIDISFVNKYLNEVNEIRTKCALMKDILQRQHTLYDLVIAKFYIFEHALNNKNIDEIHKHILISHVNVIDKIHIKMEMKNGIVRIERINLSLNNEQKKIIIQWIHDCTHIYNELVTSFNKIYINIYNKCRTKYNRKDKKFKFHFGNMLLENNILPICQRKLRDTKIKYFTEKYDVPFCIIADIIANFVSNVKGNITKLKKNQIENFVLKQRLIYKKSYSLPIQNKYVTKDGFYPRTLGKIVLDDSFSWDQINKDFHLIYDRFQNRFYMNCPFYREKIDIPDRLPMAVSDPGERTFEKIYGGDHIISVGDGLSLIIKQKLEKIEKMQKRLTDKKFNDEETKKFLEKKAKKKEKIEKTNIIPQVSIPMDTSKKKKNNKNFKKVITRTHQQIDNIVTEMHNKLSLYLCRNYDRIMVTNFSSKKVSGKKGNLNKTSKKVLGKLSHYKFRQRLQHKCEEYRCQYLEVTEEYTSVTCCNCGNVKTKKELGSKEIYDCKKCKKKIARDVNGSIGIFLKNKSKLIY